MKLPIISRRANGVMTTYEQACELFPNAVDGRMGSIYSNGEWCVTVHGITLICTLQPVLAPIDCVSGVRCKVNLNPNVIVWIDKGAN